MFLTSDLNEGRTVSHAWCEVCFWVLQVSLRDQGWDQVQQVPNRVEELDSELGQGLHEKKKKRNEVNKRGRRSKKPCDRTFSEGTAHFNSER